jgi:hypothetical protein
MEEYMSDSTRLGTARRKMLPVAILAAALVAMLAIAPLASAAPDPIKSGTTTLTINSGFNKKAGKAGIEIAAVKPSKLKGTKATFAVTGGEIEPTTGAGTVTHSGGLKVSWGKKSVTLKSITIDTKGKSVSAKIGGKTVKVGSLAGTSTARLGFGASVSAKKVKLTSAGANALNSKLTPKPTKVKVKKNGKTIVKTVKVQPFFKANMVLGGSVTEVEPGTVNVLPTGAMSFTGDPTLLAKLKDVSTDLVVIPPTTAAANVFTSPISGGTISPLGTSGTIGSAGGLILTQVLPTSTATPPATPPITTKITLGSIGVDLSAKTVSVEVVGESNAEAEGKKPLNVGNLGRSSIADLTIGSVTASPATRTVAVNATGTIQAVAAEVIEGFVKVYQGWYTQVAAQTLIAEKKVGSEKEALEQGAKIAEAKVANDHIKAGEPLGAFSFLATGE